MDKDKHQAMVDTIRYAQDDREADSMMVALMAYVMKVKLAKKRAEGRGGWFRANECSIDDLRRMLRDHVDKGDMIDVANFAMMIYAREQVESGNPDAA